MNEVMEYYDTPQPSYVEKTAGFWVRFWAFLVDTMVISAVAGLTIRPIFALMEWDMTSTNWYAPFAVLSVVVYYAYFVLLTKFLKQTVGKMIFGLRVQKDNGEALDWGAVLFRELIGRFIQKTFFFLPAIIIAFTPQNKGLADFFADTHVVHEKIYEKQV